MITRITADPAKLILGGHDIPHSVCQHLIKQFILCIAIHKAGAPHHFAPVLASPASLVVCILLKLLCKPLPQICSEQLYLFNIPYRILIYTWEAVGIVRSFFENLSHPCFFLSAYFINFLLAPLL